MEHIFNETRAKEGSCGHVTYHMISLVIILQYSTKFIFTYYLTLPTF